MPQTTAEALYRAADLIHTDGLHTGTQFIDQTTGSLDIAAAIYIVTEGGIPDVFYTDEATSLVVIAASAPAMAAIRALSDSLDTDPPATQIAPGYVVPDYIEHICNWAVSLSPFGQNPPTVSEVIGALLRAAWAADAPTAFPHQTAERSAA